MQRYADAASYCISIARDISRSHGLCASRFMLFTHTLMHFMELFSRRNADDFRIISACFDALYFQLIALLRRHFLRASRHFFVCYADGNFAAKCAEYALH